MSDHLFEVTATRPVDYQAWAALIEAIETLHKHGIPVAVKGMDVLGPLTLPDGASIGLRGGALTIMTEEPQPPKADPEDLGVLEMAARQRNHPGKQMLGHRRESCSKCIVVTAHQSHREFVEGCPICLDHARRDAAADYAAEEMGLTPADTPNDMSAQAEDLAEQLPAATQALAKAVTKGEPMPVDDPTAFEKEVATGLAVPRCRPDRAEGDMLPHCTWHCPGSTCLIREHVTNAYCVSGDHERRGGP